MHDPRTSLPSRLPRRTHPSSIAPMRLDAPDPLRPIRVPTPDEPPCRARCPRLPARGAQIFEQEKESTRGEESECLGGMRGAHSWARRPGTRDEARKEAGIGNWDRGSTLAGGCRRSLCHPMLALTASIYNGQTCPPPFLSPSPSTEQEPPEPQGSPTLLLGRILRVRARAGVGGERSPGLRPPAL